MDEKETGRLEAFSDGVFAIAITLLVLELHIDSNKDLFEQLLHQWAMFLAFVTSFFTIGIMWINHHRLFNLIKRVDHMLLLLNLLLLLFVTFVPFPTALVAEYSQGLVWQEAAMLYSGTFVGVAIAFNLLWRYATHKNRLLGPQADQRAVRTISEHYLFGPLLYVIALVLAVFSVPLSLAMNALLAVFFALPRAPLRVRRGDSSPVSDGEKATTEAIDEAIS